MAVQESEWIPIEEGIPDVGETVVVRGYGDDLATGIKDFPFSGIAVWTEEGWTCHPDDPFPYLNFLMPFTITAWRRRKL